MFVKNFFIIMICTFVYGTNMVYAVDCGITNLDTNINGIASGYAHLDASTGVNETTYGLTPGSGQWAIEFNYGVVYGQANCNTSSGNSHSYTWPSASQSDWLKEINTESTGQYCWCQATGFKDTSPYTDGPSCTVSPTSSLWVYRTSYESSSTCMSNCASLCAYQYFETLRVALYGAALPTYTVTYSCGSGVAPITNTSATYNKSFVPATNSCTKAGYTFVGWLVSNTSDIKPAETAFVWEYTENKTLVAQWTPNTLNVNWYNGNTQLSVPTASQSCTYGETFSLPTPPSARPGYHFGGWKIKTNQ